MALTWPEPLLIEDKTGPRERSPCGVVVGSGYGVINPMSTVDLAVPIEKGSRAASGPGQAQRSTRDARSAA